MATYLNLPPNGRRLIHDLAPFGLPEIPYLAAQNLPFSAPGLPTHTHMERMEINHIIKGERVYCVGGEACHLRGNHVFITWPHELHGSGSYLHGRGLHFWMQAVIPKPGSPFLGFNAERAEPLLAALWGIPRRHFRADPGMRDIYARILVLCRQGPSALASLEVSALLTQWFLLLAASALNELDDRITPDIAKALELMSRAPDAHLAIDDLAEAACLSESRFKGKFREQLGMPPGEYLLRRRTETAANMLIDSGKSLTEIALGLGFSSGQHFSVTFKKFFGQSPLTWARTQEADGLSSQTSDEAGLYQDKPEFRPWIDANGQLHGYVHKSHRGIHPGY